MREYITIGITTYNRKKTLERMALSLYESKISLPYHIRIYDDASSQYDEVYLKNLFPDAVSVIRNVDNKGADENIKSMYEHFLTTNDEFFFNADSDLIFSKGWLEKLMRLIPYTDGVLSAFNTNRHKSFKKEVLNGVGVERKEDLGSAGVLFKRSIVELILRELGNIKTSFDWEWSYVLQNNGISLYSVSESLVQHIGIDGYNSNGCNYDFGDGFLVDSLVTGQILNDVLLDGANKSSAKNKYSLFPFSEVPKGSNVIIYGAGNYGREYIKQVTKLNYCSIVAIADKNFEKMDGVINPRNIKDYNYDYIIISISRESISNEVRDALVGEGIPHDKIIVGSCKRVVR